MAQNPISREQIKPLTNPPVTAANPAPVQGEVKVVRKEISGQSSAVQNVPSASAPVTNPIIPEAAAVPLQAATANVPATPQVQQPAVHKDLEQDVRNILSIDIRKFEYDKPKHFAKLDEARKQLLESLKDNDFSIERILDVIRGLATDEENGEIDEITYILLVQELFKIDANQNVQCNIDGLNKPMITALEENEIQIQAGAFGSRTKLWEMCNKEPDTKFDMNFFNGKIQFHIEDLTRKQKIYDEAMVKAVKTGNYEELKKAQKDLLETDLALREYMIYKAYLEIKTVLVPDKAYICRDDLNNEQPHCLRDIFDPKKALLDNLYKMQRENKLPTDGSTIYGSDIMSSLREKCNNLAEELRKNWAVPEHNYKAEVQEVYVQEVLKINLKKGQNEILDKFISDEEALTLEDLNSLVTHYESQVDEYNKLKEKSGNELNETAKALLEFQHDQIGKTLHELKNIQNLMTNLEIEELSTEDLQLLKQVSEAGFDLSEPNVLHQYFESLECVDTGYLGYLGTEYNEEYEKNCGAKNDYWLTRQNLDIMEYEDQIQVNQIFADRSPFQAIAYEEGSKRIPAARAELNLLNAILLGNEQEFNRLANIIWAEKYGYQYGPIPEIYKQNIKLNLTAKYFPNGLPSEKTWFELKERRSLSETVKENTFAAFSKNRSLIEAAEKYNKKIENKKAEFEEKLTTAQKLLEGNFDNHLRFNANDSKEIKCINSIKDLDKEAKLGLTSLDTKSINADIERLRGINNAKIINLSKLLNDPQKGYLNAACQNLTAFLMCEKGFDEDLTDDQLEWFGFLQNDYEAVRKVVLDWRNTEKQIQKLEEAGREYTLKHMLYEKCDKTDKKFLAQFESDMNFKKDLYISLYKQIRSTDYRIDRFMQMSGQLNPDIYGAVAMSPQFNSSEDYLDHYDGGFCYQNVKFIATMAAFNVICTATVVAIGAEAGTFQWWAIPITAGMAASFAVGTIMDLTDRATSKEGLNLTTTETMNLVGENAKLAVQHALFRGASKGVGALCTKLNITSPYLQNLFGTTAGFYTFDASDPILSAIMTDNPIYKNMTWAEIFEEAGKRGWKGAKTGFMMAGISGALGFGLRNVKAFQTLKYNPLVGQETLQLSENAARWINAASGAGGTAFLLWHSGYSAYYEALEQYKGCPNAEAMAQQKANEARVGLGLVILTGHAVGIAEHKLNPNLTGITNVPDAKRAIKRSLDIAKAEVVETKGLTPKEKELRLQKIESLNAEIETMNPKDVNELNMQFNKLVIRTNAEITNELSASEGNGVYLFLIKESLKQIPKYKGIQLFEEPKTNSDGKVIIGEIRIGNEKIELEIDELPEGKSWQNLSLAERKTAKANAIMKFLEEYAEVGQALSEAEEVNPSTPKTETEKPVEETKDNEKVAPAETEDKTKDTSEVQIAEPEQEKPETKPLPQNEQELEEWLTSFKDEKGEPKIHDRARKIIIESVKNNSGKIHILEKLINMKELRAWDIAYIAKALPEKNLELLEQYILDIIKTYYSETCREENLANLINVLTDDKNSNLPIIIELSNTKLLSPLRYFEFAKTALKDNIPDLSPIFTRLRGKSGKEFVEQAYENLVKALGLEGIAPELCLENPKNKLSGGQFNYAENKITLPLDFYNQSPNAQLSILAHELMHAKQSIAMIRTFGIEEYVKSIVDREIRELIEVNARRGHVISESRIQTEREQITAKYMEMVKRSFAGVLNMPKIDPNSPEGQRAKEYLEAQRNYVRFYNNMEEYFANAQEAGAYDFEYAVLAAYSDRANNTKLKFNIENGKIIGWTILHNNGTVAETIEFTISEDKNQYIFTKKDAEGKITHQVKYEKQTDGSYKVTDTTPAATEPTSKETTPVEETTTDRKVAPAKTKKKATRPIDSDSEADDETVAPQKTTSKQKAEAKKKEDVLRVQIQKAVSEFNSASTPEEKAKIAQKIKQEISKWIAGLVNSKGKTFSKEQIDKMVRTITLENLQSQEYVDFIFWLFNPNKGKGTKLQRKHMVSIIESATPENIGLIKKLVKDGEFNGKEIAILSRAATEKDLPLIEELKSQGLEGKVIARIIRVANTSNLQNFSPMFENLEGKTGKDFARTAYQNIVHCLEIEGQINGIVFDKDKESSGYSVIDNMIHISEDTLKKSNADIIRTIAHEVYHGLQHNFMIQVCGFDRYAESFAKRGNISKEAALEQIRKVHKGISEFDREYTQEEIDLAQKYLDANANYCNKRDNKVEYRKNQLEIDATNFGHLVSAFYNDTVKPVLSKGKMTGWRVYDKDGNVIQTVEFTRSENGYEFTTRDAEGKVKKHVTYEIKANGDYKKTVVIEETEKPEEKTKKKLPKEPEEIRTWLENKNKNGVTRFSQEEIGFITDYIKNNPDCRLNILEIVTRFSQEEIDFITDYIKNNPDCRLNILKIINLKDGNGNPLINGIRLERVLRSVSAKRIEKVDIKKLSILLSLKDASGNSLFNGEFLEFILTHVSSTKLNRIIDLKNIEKIAGLLDENNQPLFDRETLLTLLRYISANKLNYLVWEGKPNVEELKKLAQSIKFLRDNNLTLEDDYTKNYEELMALNDLLNDRTEPQLTPEQMRLFADLYREHPFIAASSLEELKANIIKLSSENIGKLKEYAQIFRNIQSLPDIIAAFSNESSRQMMELLSSKGYPKELAKYSAGKYQKEIIEMLSIENMDRKLFRQIVNSGLSQKDFLMKAIKLVATSTFKLAYDTPNLYLSGIDTKYSTPVETGKKDKKGNSKKAVPDLSSKPEYAEELTYERAEIIKFFRTHIGEILRVLHYTDKDIVNQMMDRRTSEFRKRLIAMNTLTDENFELLSDLLKCETEAANGTFRGLNTKEKMELCLLVKRFQDMGIDMQLLKTAIANGKVNLNTVKETIERAIFEDFGLEYNPETFDFNRDYFYLVLMDMGDGAKQCTKLYGDLSPEIEASVEELRSDETKRNAKISEIRNEPPLTSRRLSEQAQKLNNEIISMLENIDNYTNQQIVQKIIERKYLNILDLSAVCVKKAAEGTFDEYITDESNRFGRANAETKRKIGDSAYEKWTHPKMKVRRIEEQNGVQREVEVEVPLEIKITVADKELTIKNWERKPKKDMFMGNETTCCSAIGIGGNGATTPIYLLNTAFNVVKMYDEKGNTVGMSRVYIGEIEVVEDGKTVKKPALIMDNIELSKAYCKGMLDPELIQIRDGFFAYMNQYAEQVIGEGAQVLFYSAALRVSSEGLNHLSAVTHIVGDVSEETVYVNAAECKWIDTKRETGIGETKYDENGEDIKPNGEVDWLIVPNDSEPEKAKPSETRETSVSETKHVPEAQNPLGDVREVPLMPTKRSDNTP